MNKNPMNKILRVISNLFMSLISGFLTFGGALVVLVALPYQIQDFTSFPWSLVLFLSLVSFSYIVLTLLPPENLPTVPALLQVHDTSLPGKFEIARH